MLQNDRRNKSSSCIVVVLSFCTFQLQGSKDAVAALTFRAPGSNLDPPFHVPCAISARLVGGRDAGWQLW